MALTIHEKRHCDVYTLNSHLPIRLYLSTLTNSLQASMSSDLSGIEGMQATNSRANSAEERLLLVGLLSKEGSSGNSRDLSSTKLDTEARQCIAEPQETRSSKTRRWCMLHTFKEPRSTSRSKLAVKDQADRNSVARLDNLDTNLTDHCEKTSRRLQRGAVVYSEQNSRHESKTISLDSAKSDGVLINTPPSNPPTKAPPLHRLDHMTKCARNKQPPLSVEHCPPPSVVLTIPLEDEPPENPRVVEQSPNDLCDQHLCEFCAYHSAVELGSMESPTIRRHSHCGSPNANEKPFVSIKNSPMHHREDTAIFKLHGDANVVGGEVGGGGGAGRECMQHCETEEHSSDQSRVCDKCQRSCPTEEVVLRTIYPPTRNRNASCSGIDMLADAILHARANGRKQHQQPQSARRPSSEAILPAQMWSCVSNMSPQRPDVILRRLLLKRPSGVATGGSHVCVSPEDRLKRRPVGVSVVDGKPDLPLLMSPSQDSTENESTSLNQGSVQRDDCDEINRTTVIKTIDLTHDPVRPLSLQSRAPETKMDFSLRVPSHGPTGSKRATTTLEPDIPLSSRIRRVSMILMSRQQQAQMEAKQYGGDSSIEATTPKEDSFNPPPILGTNSTNSIAHRVRLAINTQDTDDWSLATESPKCTNARPTLDITRSASSTMQRLTEGESSSVGILIGSKGNRMHRRTTERFSRGIGYHLGRRRHLLERRRRMADFSLAFGLFGIVVAFLDTELVARSLYSTTSVYSIGVRVLISLSTVILLALILSYHAYDVMIFLCEEYIKDWRISVTKRRVVQVTTELVICAIHPLPGINLFFNKPHSGPLARPSNPMLLGSRLYATNHQLDDTFSPYLLLILPMIGRMYLAFRALLLHSKMFNDAGSRSIGAMNKVSFDLRFVLKTLMTVCPVKALLVFILTIWLILSWTLRACELEQGENQLGLLNAAWLISVTFLSIGYGDIVPHTSCGRLVAVTTGLMGSACTALLVAVFSRKIEMTKAEKHVLHFMEANKITKRVKHCAANVLRETWLLYKNAKLMPSFNANRVRLHQRKFLQAIYSLRTMKVRQRELQDKSDTLVDLAKLQTNVFEGVADISLRQDSFQEQLKCIERHLAEIRRLLTERNTHQTNDTVVS